MKQRGSTLQGSHCHEKQIQTEKLLQIEGDRKGLYDRLWY